MSDADVYAQVARHLPNNVGVGGALITLVEPDLGSERAYNRWYEDNHFYFGAMVGPWFFAGRRWVATRDLVALRYPASSPVVQPVSLGCYLATYYTLAGHHQDALHCRHVAAMETLHPGGKGFTQRRHAYTTAASYDFGVIRTDRPHLKPFHTLDHPFDGIVLELFQFDRNESRTDVLRRLHLILSDQLVGGSPIAASLVFTPRPFVETNLPPGVRGEAPGGESTVAVLSFLDDDPRSCWSWFLRHGQLATTIGADLVFAAPFVPTLPGTDRYVEELRW